MHRLTEENSLRVVMAPLRPSSRVAIAATTAVNTALLVTSIKLLAPTATRMLSRRIRMHGDDKDEYIVVEEEVYDEPYAGGPYGGSPYGGGGYASRPAYY